jgi:hypothetical protein
VLPKPYALAPSLRAAPSLRRPRLPASASSGARLQRALDSAPSRTLQTFLGEFRDAVHLAYVRAIAASEFGASLEMPWGDVIALPKNLVLSVRWLPPSRATCRADSAAVFALFAAATIGHHQAWHVPRGGGPFRLFIRAAVFAQEGHAARVRRRRGAHGDALWPRP